MESSGIHVESTIHNQNVQINRPYYNQKSFEDKFLLSKIVQTKPKIQNVAAKMLKQLTAKMNLTNIFGIFTIFDLITRYDFKKTLIADFLSGLTGKDSNFIQYRCKIYEFTLFSRCNAHTSWPCIWCFN
jgi:hypothetical protein